MKSLCVQFWFVLALISFAALPCIADEKLDSMKAIYEKELSKIDAQYISDLSDVQKVYASRIEEALKQATNSGNLEVYEKLHAEKKRFEAERTIPENTSVQSLLDKAEQSKNVAIVNLTSKYVDGLNGLKISLMKAQDIGGAKAVQEEIKKAESVMAALPVPSDRKSEKEQELKEKTPAKKRRLVLWNQYNARNRNCGTDVVTVILIDNDKVVWQKEDVVVPWSKTKDVNLNLDLPLMSYNKIKIDIRRWHGVCGGFAEIELIEGIDNIAPKCQIYASGNYDSSRTCDKVIDGIKTSARQSVGYWMLPANTAGWIELVLPAKSGKGNVSFKP